jgi:hypothetical protein
MTEREHEPDAIPVRAIGTTLAAVAFVTVIGALIAYALAGGTRAGEGAMLGHDVSGVETTPFRTEAQGLADEAAADKRLHSYGWVDREHRVVHVPIGVAIDVMLRQQGQMRASR